MTNFSSLILCLLGIAVASVLSLSVRTSSVSPISRTEIQKSKRIALHRSSAQENQRLAILKHQLEVKCYRELCNHPRYRFLCDGPNRLLTKAPLSKSRFPSANKMRGKQFKDALKKNRVLLPDGRVIYLQPNIFYINKKLDLPLSGNESKFHILTQVVSNDKSTKENSDHPEQTFLQSGEGREGEQNIASRNKTIQIESNKESGDLGDIKFIAPTSQSRPTNTFRGRPYEVKEIVDEKPDESYNSSFYFGGKTNKTTGSQRTELRNITSSSDFLSKYGTIQKPQHPPVILKTHINSPQSPEKTYETKPLKSRKEHQKYLKPTLPPVINSTIRVQKPKAFSEPTGGTTKRTTTARQHHVEVVYTPSEPIVSETSVNRSGFIKYLQEKTTVSQPTGKLSFWNLTNAVSTKEPIPGSSKSYSASTSKARPVTLFTSEVQTTTSVFSERDYSDDVDLDWDFEKDINTSPADVFQTVDYFSEATINEADLTTTKYKDFTDQPLMFDLFPRIKDQTTEREPVWKNSRKMHFGQKPRKNPTTNDSTYPDEHEQRRSDILITDNSDYWDNENMISGMNYLERLIQNSSVDSFDSQLNLTSDRLIQFIPVVINDLREGKIPREDISVLSQAFGKYWSAVLALSKIINLDMLPVMKMKDGHDLETILESLPEAGFDQVSTEKMEHETQGFDYDFYDYMENYKELYKDTDQKGDQEAGENELDVTESIENPDESTY